MRKFLALKRGRIALVAAALAVAAILSGLYASTIQSALPADITFQGDFESGLTPWSGAQCSNTGQPSSGTHYRGQFYFDTVNPGQSAHSGKFYTAAQFTYPAEACAVITKSAANVIGQDQYIGAMFRVNSGFNPPGWGDVIYEYHFVGVLSAPVQLVAWGNRLDISVLTGACTTGCQYSHGTGYGPKAVIPIGTWTTNQWWEVITHIKWESNTTGVIQTWYRKKGLTAWHSSVGFIGIPTEQWKSGYPVPANYVDIVGTYTPKLSTAITVWMDNQIYGASLAAVEATMP